MPKVAAPSTMTEVQIISASWCKRCQVIKPDVAKACALRGIILEAVEYEEMDEVDTAAIKSLPTIRMRLNAHEPWVTYTADTIPAWKDAFSQIAISTTDTDF